MNKDMYEPEMGMRLYGALCDSVCIGEITPPSPIALTSCLAGAITEVSFATDTPDLATQAALHRLCAALSCDPTLGPLLPGALPAPHAIDSATENGRAVARTFWEDGPALEHEFMDLLVTLSQNIFVAWEEDMHIERSHSVRMLTELTHRAVAFEFAAQELCDAVIERKLVPGLWSAGECITALAAASGRRQALALGGTYIKGTGQDADTVTWGLPAPDALDAVAHVMTREAIRGGVEAGSDWWLGLAANDMPLNAPIDLIRGIEPLCQGFFRAITLPSWRDQAVACAKAAGRMLAVAAGGSLPEIEPTIAKPLAMAALAETYRYVSHSRASMTG